MGGVLGCDTIQFSRRVLNFQINMPPTASGQNSTQYEDNRFSIKHQYSSHMAALRLSDNIKLHFRRT